MKKRKAFIVVDLISWIVVFCLDVCSGWDRATTIDYTSTGDFIGPDNVSTGAIKKLDSEIDDIYTDMNKNYGLITFSLGVPVTLNNNDYVVMGKLTVPAGKTLEVVRMGICQTGSYSAVTNLIVQAYNDTDTAEICNSDDSYEAFSGETADATDQVYFRLYNNGTGSSYEVVGFAVIMIY